MDENRIVARFKRQIEKSGILNMVSEEQRNKWYDDIACIERSNASEIWGYNKAIDAVEAALKTNPLNLVDEEYDNAKKDLEEYLSELKEERNRLSS